jgi:hypothetical protein
VRRNATPSSRGSGSGRGSRLRLTLLFATIAAFLLVPVAQAAAGSLKINVEGTGSGTLFTPEGGSAGSPPVECSYTPPGPTTGTCESEFVEPVGEEKIFLRAEPQAGSEFSSFTITEGESAALCFSGEPFPQFIKESDGGAGLCLIGPDEISENAEITAVFNETPGFLLTVARTGEGTVASSPGGIVCGVKCKEKFEGTVTLTASPASGYAFNSWAGCTEHVGLTCKVTMDKAKTVKASFVATPSLSIEKAGSGQGKVSATGISCDENCSKATSAIKIGTSVTVKVASAKGSEPAVFEGGTGSASGCSGATCTFTISEDSSVKVKFDPKPTQTLTVKLIGPAAYKGKVTGKGTVKGLTASAISCGSGCTTQTESFFKGDTVTLTAVAGTGYTFTGWQGASDEGTCTGTTSPCTLPISFLSRTLSAEFE